MHSRCFENDFDQLNTKLSQLRVVVENLKTNANNVPCLHDSFMNIENESEDHEYSLDTTRSQKEIAMCDASDFNKQTIGNLLEVVCEYMRVAGKLLRDQDDTLQSFAVSLEDVEQQISHCACIIEQMQDDLRKRNSAFVLFGKEKIQGEEAISGHEFATLRLEPRQKKSAKDFEDLPF